MLKAYILHQGDPTAACLIAYANNNQEATALSDTLTEADRAPFLDSLASRNQQARIESDPNIIKQTTWSYRGQLCKAQGGTHAHS